MALKYARVNASRGPQKQQAVILVPTPGCQQLLHQVMCRRAAADGPNRAGLARPVILAAGLPGGTLPRASGSRLDAAD
jgi:hypothetical protein